MRAFNFKGPEPPPKPKRRRAPRAPGRTMADTFAERIVAALRSPSGWHDETGRPVSRPALAGALPPDIPASWRQFLRTQQPIGATTLTTTFNPMEVVASGHAFQLPNPPAMLAPEPHLGCACIACSGRIITSENLLELVEQVDVIMGTRMTSAQVERVPGLRTLIHVQSRQTSFARENVPFALRQLFQALHLRARVFWQIDGAPGARPSLEVD